MHKEFVLNYPNEEQANAAWICGTKSGRYGDKIKLAGLKLVDYIFSFMARFSLTTLSSLDMLVVIQRVAYL